MRTIIHEEEGDKLSENKPNLRAKLDISFYKKQKKKKPQEPI